MHNLDPVFFSEVFTTPGGDKVLLELTRLYYDRPSYTKGDQFETAYKEGQRSVVEFILRKMAEKPLTLESEQEE